MVPEAVQKWSSKPFKGAQQALLEALRGLFPSWPRRVPPKDARKASQPLPKELQSSPSAPGRGFWTSLRPLETPEKWAQ